MIRLAKLTDYAIVLMSHLAAEPEAQMTAASLAQASQIPMPTASKILKVLAREGLLVSHRGASGGYALARAPRDISVAQVIAAMEGPIAMTECAEIGDGECEQESICRVRGNWQRINDAVTGALSSITLEEMAQPFGVSSTTTQTLVSLGSLTPH